MTRKSTLLNAVDFTYALIDCYKKLNLTEEELAVILAIDHLLQQGNTFVTPDMLSLKMNLKPAEIDKALVGLVSRNFLTYEKAEGGMRTSLDNLKAIVYAEFRRSIEQEHANLSSKERADRLAGLVAFYEKNLARTLSPLESATIADWVDSGYGDEEIKNALLDAIRDNKRTIRAVDKALRAKRMEQDIAKEGTSAVSENWDKNIDETVQLVKSLWGGGDDRK
jgi:DNA replication protein